ncbi:PEP-CTERM sorting domain-containing protein [Kiritimatiella glycovorans]|uniref:Ice-binding protein C-terminal domain-containing protein n=1 Tax=Kiritimatiella glycovorans TaxID=1307763 RepID=A0A0G3ELR6_9BACT|nr:PEP-CTERM sorting domain-containing protein [Kiritimatiella glycovorans]AKJ65109.1 hypothetical protein L21SP4_01873 [Kiritimatiella glycovorans]
MKLQSFLIVMLMVPMLAAAQYSDDFEDGTIDSSLWSTFKDAPLDYAEQNGRLELIAPADQDDLSAGVTFVHTVSSGDWAEVSVKFNSSECTNETFLNINVENLGREDDFLVFGNGHSLQTFGVDSRVWVATKFTNDVQVAGAAKVETTTEDSGTFYMTYTNDLFYFSSTGFGPGNAFWTNDASGWLDPTEFEFSMELVVWSNNPAIAGSGAYFDDFQAVPEPASMFLWCGGLLGLGFLRRRIRMRYTTY